MSGTEPTYDNHTPCPDCGLYLEVGDWPWCPHGSTRPSHHSVHANERAVVFENPETGEVRYPGRNDVPIPERYAKQGFVRREFTDLHSIEKFERQHGVLNDKIHYNPGNSADQEERTPPPRLSDDQKRKMWMESVAEAKQEAGR